MKKYSKDEVIKHLSIAYDLSVVPYYPLNQSTITDFKDEDGKWKKTVFVGGYRFVTRSHLIWSNMHQRIRNGKSGKQPTYANVTITEEWKDFEGFTDWVITQPQFYQKDWQFDSDLLSTGSKKYSPSTCTFIPSEINGFLKEPSCKKRSLPTGVYENGKRFQAQMDGIHIGMFDTPIEASHAYLHAKHEKAVGLAKKWSGLISSNAEEALLHYWEPSVDSLPH